MVLLNKCCCLFNLTTGGVLLGWLGVLDSLFWIIVTVVGLCNVDAVAEAEEKDISEHNLIIILVLYGAIHLLALMSSALLIVGSVKRNPLYLQPWLICELISIVILVFSAFVHFLSEEHRAAISDGLTWKYAFALLTGLCSIGLEIYLYICIYSLYQLLKIERNANGGDVRVQASHLVLSDEFKDSLPPYTALSS